MAPIPSKFYCRDCGNQQNFDVPEAEIPDRFAEKIPCSRCGTIGKMSWTGPA